MAFRLLIDGEEYLLPRQGETVLGRSGECDIHLSDNRISRRHATISVRKGRAFLADLGSTNGTRLNGEKIREERLLTHGDRIELGPIVLHVSVVGDDETLTPSDTLVLEGELQELLKGIAEEETAGRLRSIIDSIGEKKRRLADMAYVDQLTGLRNRRWFDRVLGKECVRAKRYNHSLALIMIDIDHFKHFNDTYGHQKGDEVLAAVGTLLVESARQVDTPARYGGEEMALILPETGLEQAAQAAERIRRKIEADLSRKVGVEMTASFGVAAGTEFDAAALIERADRALYKAKEKGRNRVVMVK